MSGRILRLMVSVMAAGMIAVACSADDPAEPTRADGSGDTTTSATPDTALTTAPTTTASAPVTAVTPADPVVPEGFGVVPALVTPPGGGKPCEVCLWMADTHDLRRRGLMGVTDLGGPDGMAFVYGEPRTTNFTMRDTRLPLSIAFYDVDGRYLDAFDMEPCRAEPCTSYRTPAGFTVAVEVPRGELGRFQMVPGSRLELVPLADHCDTPSSH